MARWLTGFGDFAATLLADVGVWARAPDVVAGMNLGWSGWAWVVAQLGDAGLLPITAPMRRLLHRRLARSAPHHPRHSGYFAGPFARPLVLATLASTDESFLPLLDDALKELDGLPEPTCPDLNDGAGGAVLALYQIHLRHPRVLSGRTIRRFDGAFKRRLAEARKRAPYAVGLAHGLAGFALAVEASERLVGFPGLEETRRWIADSLTQAVVRDRRGRPVWPFRIGDPPQRHFAWCNGPAGAMLALVLAHRLGGYRPYDRLVSLGLEMHARRRLDHLVMNDSLCCGALGVAEAYHGVAVARGDLALRRRARRSFTATDPEESRAELVRTGRFLRLHEGIVGRIYLWYELRHPGLLPSVGFDLFRSP